MESAAASTKKARVTLSLSPPVIHEFRPPIDDSDPNIVHSTMVSMKLSFQAGIFQSLSPPARARVALRITLAIYTLLDAIAFPKEKFMARVSDTASTIDLDLAEACTLLQEIPSLAEQHQELVNVNVLKVLTCYAPECKNNPNPMRFISTGGLNACSRCCSKFPATLYPPLHCSRCQYRQCYRCVLNDILCFVLAFDAEVSPATALRLKEPYKLDPAARSMSPRVTDVHADLTEEDSDTGSDLESPDSEPDSAIGAGGDSDGECDGDGDGNGDGDGPSGKFTSATDSASALPTVKDSAKSVQRGVNDGVFVPGFKFGMDQLEQSSEVSCSDGSRSEPVSVPRVVVAAVDSFTLGVHVRTPSASSESSMELLRPSFPVHGTVPKREPTSTSALELSPTESSTSDKREPTSTSALEPSPTESSTSDKREPTSTSALEPSPTESSTPSAPMPASSTNNTLSAPTSDRRPSADKRALHDVLASMNMGRPSSSQMSSVKSSSAAGTASPIVSGGSDFVPSDENPASKGENDSSVKISSRKKPGVKHRRRLSASTVPSDRVFPSPTTTRRNSITSNTGMRPASSGSITSAAPAKKSVARRRSSELTAQEQSPSGSSHEPKLTSQALKSHLQNSPLEVEKSSVALPVIIPPIPPPAPLNETASNLAIIDELAHESDVSVEYPAAESPTSTIAPISKRIPPVLDPKQLDSEPATSSLVTPPGLRSFLSAAKNSATGSATPRSATMRSMARLKDVPPPLRTVFSPPTPHLAFLESEELFQLVIDEIRNSATNWDEISEDDVRGIVYDALQESQSCEDATIVAIRDAWDIRSPSLLRESLAVLLPGIVWNDDIVLPGFDVALVYNSVSNNRRRKSTLAAPPSCCVSRDSDNAELKAWWNIGVTTNECDLQISPDDLTKSTYAGSSRHYFEARPALFAASQYSRGLPMGCVTGSPSVQCDEDADERCMDPLVVAEMASRFNSTEFGRALTSRISSMRPPDTSFMYGELVREGDQLGVKPADSNLVFWLPLEVIQTRVITAIHYLLRDCEMDQITRYLRVMSSMTPAFTELFPRIAESARRKEVIPMLSEEDSKTIGIEPGRAPSIVFPSDYSTLNSSRLSALAAKRLSRIPGFDHVIDPRKEDLDASKFAVKSLRCPLGHDLERPKACGPDPHDINDTPKSLGVLLPGRRFDEFIDPFSLDHTLPCYSVAWECDVCHIRVPSHAFPVCCVDNNCKCRHCPVCIFQTLVTKLNPEPPISAFAPKELNRSEESRYSLPDWSVVPRHFTKSVRSTGSFASLCETVITQVAPSTKTRKRASTRYRGRNPMG